MTVFVTGRFTQDLTSLKNVLYFCVLPNFRAGQWHRRYILECREEMPKIHSTNSIVFLCEWKHFSNCPTVLIGQHYHGKFGCVNVGITNGLERAIRYEYVVGLVFNVVFSVEHQHMLCVVYHNDHHLFYVLLHLHRRNLWAFSLCIRLCNGKCWTKSPWNRSTSIWTQTIAYQRGDEQSGRDPCNNFQVSIRWNRFWMISTNFSWSISTRIFGMVAEINSGSIFWLLPLNIVLMSMSMYNIEIVCTSKCNATLIIPFWNMLTLSCYSSAIARSGEFIISIDLYGMRIVLASFALLLRIFDYTANWWYCSDGLFVKLVRFAYKIAKVSRIDDDSFTTNAAFHRIKHNLLHSGNTWKGIQNESSVNHHFQLYQMFNNIF